ncbi:MAG: fumarylacetoacetate hydrolase family protein, partial [Phycisphaerales bacterium]|nr:fumarylacetoacetate hydrolase family protein [Phycisphaerales bacterium]
GTPGGVGYRREPPVALRDGDIVSVAVSGVGEITNPVVAEPSFTVDP